MFKVCKGCGEKKPLTEFYPEKKGKHGRRSRCIPCYATYVETLRHTHLDTYRERARAYAARWRRAHPAEARARSRANQIRHVRDLRDRVFSRLGGQCQKCGEGDRRLLHIDHKNNDGNVQRAAFRGNKTAFLSHVLLVPAEFQLLCPNCNHRKRLEASPGPTTRQSGYSLRWAAKIRTAALAHLGNKCPCGQDDQSLLCIDHVNGGGTRDRKRLGGSTSLYKDVLVVSGKYQCLCHNCNWLKRHANAEWGPYRE